MKSIGVLGCGWLGLPLATELVNFFEVVKGATRTKEKLRIIGEKGILPYFIDLTPNYSGVPTDFFDVDVLIVNLPPRNQNGQVDYHEKQLKSIIEEASKHRPWIIFISSTAVYPSNNQTVIESDAHEVCLSRSGISLLKLERLFTDQRIFDTTVIRFSGLFGPGRLPGRFLAGKEDMPGGTNPVNLIHLEDCIGVISTIIMKDKRREVYHATSSKERIRKAYYQNAAKELGLKVPTFNDQPLAFKKIDASKLITETGYEFKY